MATEPERYAAEPATAAQTEDIPAAAGVDDIDLAKLFPSAYELPLDAGGKPVPRRTMNALLKGLMQSLFFLQQGGVFSYSSEIDYTIGTIVQYGGHFYRCIKANGPSSTVAAPTSAAHWDRLVGISEMRSAVTSAVPAGCVSAFAGTAAPAGWLVCNGAAVSRSVYPALFAAIGTLYGTGNGSTTFNLPNFNNRFLRGGNPGQFYNPQLPTLTAQGAGVHAHTRGSMNITGTFPQCDDLYESGTSRDQVTGAFFWSGEHRGGTAPGDHDEGSERISFEAWRSWTGNTSYEGGHTHNVVASGVATGGTVLPLSAGTLYIIKT